ncbi:serine hydrolase [Rhodovibrio sodomensis]|uniref:serine hydrolase n=1 Tax=Rhodovibrio sodomensis TaxID=1088 RepID=UPI00190801FD
MSVPLVAGVLLTGVLATRPASAAERAWIVVDAASGAVIEAHRPQMQHYPASLTKMMTLYMVFDALAAGELQLDEKMYVSPHAQEMPPTELGLHAGDRITVETAIKALVTKSANDAAVVIAEHLAGTEWDFAMDMTATARRLGLDDTKFRNASGLPHPYQVTTAEDMAQLARALIDDFPGYYKYFSIERMRYQGRVYRNHNNLLGRYDGVDGIKTGYIDASGYNLVASAKRNGRRVIAVALGGRSPAARDRRVAHLLDAGFKQLPARMPPVPHAKPERGGYAVQVGAFSSKPAAERIAKRALEEARQALAGGIRRVAHLRGDDLYRARVVGLTVGAAERACTRLKRRGMDCLVVQDTPTQVAETGNSAG